MSEPQYMATIFCHFPHDRDAFIHVLCGQTKEELEPRIRQYQKQPNTRDIVISQRLSPDDQYGSLWKIVEVRKPKHEVSEKTKAAWEMLRQQIQESMNKEGLL